MRVRNKSIFQRLLNIRNYTSQLNPNEFGRFDKKTIDTNELKEGVSKLVGAYLQKLGKQPKTSRPSHYNETTKYNNKNPWRLRTADEYSSIEEAPYQHHHYDPPNDKTTELYNNFRDSSHSNTCVALREHPPRRFVPGAANPYLRYYSRLYSNHYIRLAADSETGDAVASGMMYMFVVGALIMWPAPAVYLYLNPEYGGGFNW